MQLTIHREQSSSPIQAIQQQAKPANLPLGTADWFSFQGAVQATFGHGDFFLGHTMGGRPVGVHDDGHVLVCAGTRSGKGVSLIVPNLVTRPGSVFVNDPKGENAILTARRRANGSKFAKGMGQKVFIIDPFGDVHRNDDDYADLKASYNPLDMIREDKMGAVDDAARIADSLIDREASVSDPFWNDAAHGLIKGIILHVASSRDFRDDQRHLVTVRRLISEGYQELRAFLQSNNPDVTPPSAFALLFRAMRRSKAFDEEVALAGERYARLFSSDPKLMASVSEVANTNLDFLASPEMKRCVMTSSFQLSDLKNDPKGISIYLCIPQYAMETHFRLQRMIVSLMTAEMMRLKYQPRSGHQILMALDEFAGLKRMRMIEHSCAQIAGSGVKMMFVVQDLGQLKEVYKDNWQTFLGNTTTRLFFSNHDPFTCEIISKLAGNTETIRRTNTQSASQGQSSSQAFGETRGFSGNQTSGSSSSWNSGSQGTSYSGSVSSSQNSGYSFSQTETNTAGRNQSSTQGFNESLHLRALITPDEVSRLFGDDRNPLMIAMINGSQPLALRRVRYFNDIMFCRLFDPHPDHPLPPTKLDFEKRLARKKRLALEEKQRQEAARLAQMKAKAEAVQRSNKEYFDKRFQDRQFENQLYQEQLVRQHRAKYEEILIKVKAYAIFFAIIATFILGIG